MTTPHPPSSDPRPPWRSVAPACRRERPARHRDRPAAGAHPRGRRRQRLLRHRHRGGAPAGRDHRLRRPRAGGQPRWHLAGQRLPGGRLRSPQPPLLVLLRAQARLVARLRAPVEDPRVPGAGRGRRRRPAAPALRHRRPRRAVGRRRAGLAAGDQPRAAHRRRPGQRLRRPGRAAPAAGPGDRGLPGAVLPLRPVGPLGRPDRAAGRRRRHRLLGRAVRARAAADGGAGRRLPAHPAVGHPAGRPRLHRPRAAPLPAAARRAAARPHPPVLEPGGPAARAHRRRAAAPGLRAAVAARARAPGARPGPARPAHPGLRHRLQARDRQRRLPARADPAQRRGGRLPGRRGPRALGGRRRRRRARGRRDRLRHRLPGHGPPAGPPAHRPGGPHAARGVGARRHPGPPRHHGRRLPQPLPAARAQHRARPHLGRDHDRGADPLRRGGAGGHGPGRRPRGVPSGAGGLQRAAAGRAHRHRVERRWLPLLVPRRAGPQLHAVADAHRDLPAADAAVRRRRRRLRTAHRPARRRPGPPTAGSARTVLSVPGRNRRTRAS